MSTVQGKGLVTWHHPRFAECVHTWSAVRVLDPWPYDLYDLRLWRSVLEVMGDPNDWCGALNRLASGTELGERAQRARRVR
jgi:hypothetical protein